MTLVVRESTGAPRTAVQNIRTDPARQPTAVNPIDNAVSAVVKGSRFLEPVPALCRAKGYVLARSRGGHWVEPVPVACLPQEDSMRFVVCFGCGWRPALVALLLAVYPALFLTRKRQAPPCRAWSRTPRAESCPAPP